MQLSKFIQNKILIKCFILFSTIVLLDVNAPQARSRQSTFKKVEVEPGIELAYQEAGKGKPILFVPGWTFPGTVFQKQLHALKTKHRVILLDPRSVGRSSQTTKGHDYNTYGRDVHQIIRKLKLKELILVGWSYGCLQNFDYVRNYGTKKLSAFVCIDQNPKPLGTTKNWSEGPESAFEDFKQGVTKNRRHFTGKYIDEYFLIDSNSISKKHRQWLIDQSLITPTAIANKLMDEGMISDYTKTVTDLPSKVPTLFIVNRSIFSKVKKWWSSKPKAAEIKSLGGHYMFYEFSNEFNSILEKFLTRSIKNP